nr:hypothetical protein 17 [Desulfobacterales bacterium]
MPFPKINDRKLLQLIDKDKLSQSAAARELGVSRQAVHRRLRELRGETSKVVATAKVKAAVDSKLDAIDQLGKINDHANWMLDHVMRWIKGDDEAIQVLEGSVRKVNIGTREHPEYVESVKFKDPHEIAIKAMAEIRGQLKLQLEIFQALYSLQAAEEFQNTVLQIIGEVDPDVRREIIHRLNKERSVRSAVRFR